MQFTLTQHAEEHERFSSVAFDRQIGDMIPVNVGDNRQRGKLVAATVSPDGRRVELTLEVGDSSTVAHFIREGFEPGVFGRGGYPPPAVPTEGHGA